MYDVAITRRLQLSAVILGLHDHLIAGEGRQYFSFREAGLLATGFEEIASVDTQNRPLGDTSKPAIS